MASFVGYDNLLDTATVTASTGVAANAHNYLTNDAWSPGGAASLRADAGAPVSADYVGVISSGCDSLTLAYQEGTAWVNVLSVTNPGSVWCAPFDALTKRVWRLSVTGIGPQVYHVSIGKHLVLPTKLSLPFVEPKYAGRVRAHNADSIGGQYAGRSVFATTYEVSLPLKNLAPAWLDTYWEPWAAHMRMKPFFLLWDSTNHTSDAAYLWLRDGDKFPAPHWNHPMFQTLSLALEGLA